MKPISRTIDGTSDGLDGVEAYFCFTIRRTQTTRVPLDTSACTARPNYQIRAPCADCCSFDRACFPVEFDTGIRAFASVFYYMFRLFSSSLSSSTLLHQCHDQDSDTSNTISTIPDHPTQNPHVPEGRYEAIVHDVKVVAYGQRDNHNEDIIIQLFFFLPFPETFFSL